MEISKVISVLEDAHRGLTLAHNNCDLPLVQGFYTFHSGRIKNLLSELNAEYSQMVLEANGEEPTTSMFQCPNCSCTVFKKQYSWNLKRTPMGIAVFKCEGCSREFSIEEQMRLMTEQLEEGAL